MALYRGSCKLAGLGKVPGTTYVTETEYNCLPSSKLTDGVNYGIYDDGSDNTITKFIKNGCEYCIPQGGTKYGYVDILLVGGGGCGGYSNTDSGGGGGGGGGFVECFCYPINSVCQSYPISIGNSGGDTNALGLIAYHGGVGRSSSGGGSTGGSGGGGTGTYYEPYKGGYGTLVEGQGYPGGDGSYCGSGNNNLVGGGGGGAGGPGCPGIYGQQSGNGGIGKISCMSGEPQYYSGGGGGGAGNDAYGGVGGCGGGGNGGRSGCVATYYGGGGGGGFCHCTWRAGYQGIVIIRYKKDGSCGLKMSGGGCRYECGDYYIHCFTNVNSTECFIPVFK